jgi:hypothetical protein
MTRLFKVATTIEIIGITACGVGVGIELALGADVGFMLISGGSVLIAAGGVLFGKFVKLWRQ